MIDWERFIGRVSWFLQPGDTAEVGEPRPWTRGAVDGLPILSALLGEATVTPVVVRGDSYELLAWGPPDERRGWLCRAPHGPVDGLAVAPVHLAFWAVCGGIVEQFGGPDTWWSNHNEVLTVDGARESVVDPLDAYSWIWEQEGFELRIDPADYYAVGVEANGNLTLARPDGGRLLLFAPDSGFSGITPLDGSPENSLYTFDDVPDLGSWIEVNAAAWRRG